jgi:hypothetical protein
MSSIHNNTIIITVPASIEKYTDHLANFIDGMLRKLDKNSHKNTPTLKTLPAIMDNLREEIIEFEEQLAINRFDENSLIELMDQANFSFLAYVALRLQGVEHASHVDKIQLSASSNHPDE